MFKFIMQAIGGQALVARCPHCQSDEIEATEANFDAGAISQRVECPACRKEWFDLYTLREIVESEG